MAATNQHQQAHVGTAGAGATPQLLEAAAHPWRLG
jgi:hypothetical protein